MEQTYLSYLDLLDSLGRELEKLTDLAQQKTAAVRKDDLNGLDQILKQEQVISLSLRGVEQRRAKQLGQLGLESVKLSDLPAHYPAELRLKAKEAVETLQRRYRVYQAAAEVARNTLECNLHEIEKFLAAAENGGASGGGPGYAPGSVELPPSFKTDFRA